MLPEVPPAVEWWDGPYLANRSYEDVSHGLQPRPLLRTLLQL